MKFLLLIFIILLICFFTLSEEAYSSCLLLVSSSILFIYNKSLYQFIYKKDKAKGNTKVIESLGRSFYYYIATCLLVFGFHNLIYVEKLPRVNSNEMFFPKLEWTVFLLMFLSGSFFIIKAYLADPENFKK